MLRPFYDNLVLIIIKRSMKFINLRKYFNLKKFGMYGGKIYGHKFPSGKYV